MGNIYIKKFNYDKNKIKKSISDTFEIRSIKKVEKDQEDFYQLEVIKKDKINSIIEQYPIFCNITDTEEILNWLERNIESMEKSSFFTNELDIVYKLEDIRNENFGKELGDILAEIIKIYESLENNKPNNILEKIQKIDNQIDNFLKTNKKIPEEKLNLVEIFKFILSEYKLMYSFEYSSNSELANREKELVALRGDFIKFILKSQLELDDSFYMVTPLRMEIYYYTKTIKHFVYLINKLGFKDNNKQFFEKFLGGNNSNVIGSGYLRGHRFINFSLISKFNRAYQKNLLSIDLKLFFKYFNHSQEILNIISNDYSFKNLKLFEEILFIETEKETNKGLISVEALKSPTSDKAPTEEVYDVYSPFLDKIGVKIIKDAEMVEGNYYVIDIDYDSENYSIPNGNGELRRLEKWCDQDLNFFEDMEDNSTIGGKERIIDQNQIFILKILEIIEVDGFEYICGAVYEKAFARGTRTETPKLSKILYQKVYLRQNSFKIIGKVDSFKFI